jgi:histidinol-phosphate aminotransferase
VISNENNIAEMLKIRGPYDINAVAYHAAKAALEDIESLENYVDEVMNTAKPLVENFFLTKEIEFFQSSCEFFS